MGSLGRNISGFKGLEQAAARVRAIVDGIAARPAKDSTTAT